MRLDMVEVAPGVLRAMGYWECWLCGGDFREDQLSFRDLCAKCDHDVEVYGLPAGYEAEED